MFFRFDFVLTNSVFVASEVKAYLQEYLNFSLPVRPILLPTELRKSKKSAKVLNDNIRKMASEEYVLCVATIEVRKNHMYQVRIWERLIKEFGEKIPKLVWVGKWGWQIDDLRHHLAEQGCVGDWLFIFNDISDDELEFLYNHCLFTIYTSFAEGFGLPIGESPRLQKALHRIQYHIDAGGRRTLRPVPRTLEPIGGLCGRPGHDPGSEGSRRVDRGYRGELPPEDVARVLR